MFYHKLELNEPKYKFMQMSTYVDYLQLSLGFQLLIIGAGFRIMEFLNLPINIYEGSIALIIIGLFFIVTCGRLKKDVR